MKKMPVEIMPQKVKKLMNAILKTRNEEIGCQECYNALDRFAEMLREGQNVEQVMPLVHQHLDMCRDCQEEFQGLLDALEEINQ
jgi:hypothetical protein